MNQALTPFSLSLFALLLLSSVSSSSAQAVSPSPDRKTREKKAVSFEKAPANNGKKNHGPIARSTNTGGLAGYSQRANNSSGTLPARTLDEGAIAAKQYYETGVSLQSSGRYEEAIVAFKQAIKLVREHAQAHYGLGVAYHSLKDYKKAGESFRLAVQFDPDWPEAHFKLGLVSYVLGRMTVAVEEYKTLLKLNSSLAHLLERIIRVENSSVGLLRNTNESSLPTETEILPGPKFKESSNGTAQSNTDTAPNESLSRPDPSVENSSAGVLKSPSESSPVTKTEILPANPKLKESSNETVQPNTYVAPNAGLSKREPPVENSTAGVLKSSGESSHPTKTEIPPSPKIKESSNETVQPNTDVAPNAGLSKREPPVESSNAGVLKSSGESSHPTKTEALPGPKFKESSETVQPNTTAAPSGSLSKLDPSVKEMALTVSQPTGAITTSKAATEDSVLTGIYRVGVGDVLDIRLLNTATSRSTLYTVGNGGMIDLPLAGGPVTVAGLTTDEIQTRLEAELKRLALLDRAQLSVGVRQYASHDVILTGLLNNPGTRFLRREAVPLYVIMAEAQLRPDSGRVTVVRDGATQVLDINDPAALNFIVKSGDVINVTARPPEFYYVGGRIKYPGQKAFQSGITVLQAILAAGGVSRQNDNKIELSREGADGRLTTSEYSLKEIKAGKIADPKLMPGDRVEVVN